VKVPASARLASVEVGLWGGTGRVSVAEITLDLLDAPRASTENP